jgi:Glycosyl transferase family 11
MIIVKLMGGLGNQMFQYALGRAISIRVGAELKVDISSFCNGSFITKREYMLDAFNVEVMFATNREVKRLKHVSRSQITKITQFIHGNYPIRSHTYIKEKNVFVFDPDVFNTKEGYFDGYWQNEKYFMDAQDVLRKEFTLKNPLTGKNKEIAERISRSNSVSIHIRRGDYATDPTTRDFHGICRPDYYTACLDYFARRIKQPHFFVFSDEPEWVREKFKISFPCTVIDHNTPERCHEDLRLMALCRHHIIANSSFSWWGAWLDSRPDKVVLGPQRWLNVDSLDTSDLLPREWIRI